MTISNLLIRKIFPKILIAIFFFIIAMEVGSAVWADSNVDQIAPSASEQTNKAKLQETYGKLPLSFEVNQGQTDNQVKFISRGHGYNLFLTPTEAVLALKKAQVEVKAEALKKVEVEETKNPLAPVSGGEGRGEGAVLRMKLIGANPTPQIAGIDVLPGKVNYFIGNDPSKWRNNIPTYTKVEYKDIYPGVDLVYYGNQRQLEYDFIISPGTNPGIITLGFKGANDIELNSQGDLVLHATDGEVIKRRPIVYQEIGSIRNEIVGGYVLKGQEEVSFQVAAYDGSLPLIIDPVPLLAFCNIPLIILSMIITLF